MAFPLGYHLSDDRCCMMCMVVDRKAVKMSVRLDCKSSGIVANWGIRACYPQREAEVERRYYRNRWSVR